MLRSIISRLSKSEGLLQSGLTVIGNVFATGLSAIALLTISRALGPELFGQFSVGFAIIIMLNKVHDFGLNAAVLKYASTTLSNKDWQAHVDFVARVKFGISLIFMVIGLLISPWLIRILHFKTPFIIYSSFVISICSTWYEHVLTQLQSRHRFTQAVVANALQAGAKLVLVVPMILLGSSSVIPTFIIYMVSPVAALLFSKRLLGKEVQFFANSQGLSHPLRHRLLNMARHSALGFIAAGIIENVDVLFVQGYLNEFETGLLSGVSRIAMMVMLIAYSFGNVLYPRVARYQHQHDLDAYIKKAAMLSLGAIIAFFVSIPLAKPLIILTVGRAYLDGAPILVTLLAASFLTIATIPFLALFYSFKADWYFSVSGVLQLVIVILGNAWFVPIYGLEASAWTRLASRLFLCLFTITCALVVYQRKRAHAALS